MVSAGEIKQRINGIKDTKKITDAMYMISSAKMRKALRELEETTPYFKSIREKIGELFHYIPTVDNRYFRVIPPQDQPHQNHGVILITSDKGMCGAYNQTAISVCEEYMSRHPRTTVFIIGEYGRQYFMNKKLPFEAEFHYCAAHPNLTDARHICADLLELYDNGRLDEINIIHTDFMGSRQGECKKITLLPLAKTNFYQETSAPKCNEKEFLPSPGAVLEGIVPSCLTGYIYGCLVESFCSEQQARMNAMKSASDNAEQILKDLQVQYNKIRQAAITNEMIEISAGSMAQRKKRLKSFKGEKYDE